VKNDEKAAQARKKSRTALAVIIALLIGAAVASTVAVRRLGDSAPAASASTSLIGAPSADTPPPGPKPPPAGPQELAIFAPIVVGSTSKGWKIEEISAVHEGSIQVRFVEEKGRGVVDLIIAAPSEDGALPPVTTEHYAIFYSARRALPEDGDRLAKLLARAIEKNPTAPVPPGLTPYNARPKEHQPL
jgi:hypothetical protein